jgi:probable HAF family extracellular repeat protein
MPFAFPKYRAARHARSAVILLLVAFAIAVALSPPVAAAASRTTPSRYALTVLPTLGAAFDLSNGAGVNNRGWIVGDANVPGSTSIANATEHAAVWRNGAITDLGTLGGPNSSIGFVARPNDTGLLSGNAQTGTVDPFGEGWGLNFGCDTAGDPCAGSQYETRGFVWRSGVIRPLPTLGGNNALAFGGANDQGEVVGMAEDAFHDPTCTAPQVFDWKPVIWGPRYGEIRELPQYPGDSIGAVSAVNDRGQTVGGSGSCGPPTFNAIAHALLWQGSSITNLGSLGGQFNNLPTAINNLGQVVGWSDLPGDTLSSGIPHAFLWQNGVMTDLGTLPGDASSFAYAINDLGQVVGQSCNKSENCRAFLWQNGTMTDVNTITNLNTRSGAFELFEAEGINDLGEIVGFGVYPDGQGQAFAAIPCDRLAFGTQACASTGNTATHAELSGAVPPDLRGGPLR